LLRNYNKFYNFDIVLRKKIALSAKREKRKRATLVNKYTTTFGFRQMRINDILLENKKVTEAPLGMLSKIGHGVKKAFGSGKSSGVLDSGNAANKLKQDYMKMLGSTGQEAEPDNLIGFLQKAGYPVDRVKSSFGGAPEPKEPAMDPENPAAADAAQATPTGNRPQGGGKVPGQQSQTPGAVAKRNGRRDAANAKATTGGAGAFNQMGQQLSQPGDAPAKGKGKAKGVQPTDLDQTNANLQTKIAANKAADQTPPDSMDDFVKQNPTAKYHDVTGEITPYGKEVQDKRAAAEKAKANSMPQLGAVPPKKEKAAAPANKAAAGDQDGAGQAAINAANAGQDPEAAAKAAMAAKNPNLAAMMAKQDAEDNDPATAKSQELGPKGRATLGRLGKQSQDRANPKQGTLDLSSRQRKGRSITEALSDKQIDSAFLMAVQDKAKGGGSGTAAPAGNAPSGGGSSSAAPAAGGSGSGGGRASLSRELGAAPSGRSGGISLDGIDTEELKAALTAVVNGQGVDRAGKAEVSKLLKKI
jgi:hypothetical protein